MNAVVVEEDMRRITLRFNPTYDDGIDACFPLS
jgi:hypothetical protein